MERRCALFHHILDAANSEGDKHNELMQVTCSIDRRAPVRVAILNIYRKFSNKTFASIYSLLFKFSHLDNDVFMFIGPCTIVITEE